MLTCPFLRTLDKSISYGVGGAPAASRARICGMGWWWDTQWLLSNSGANSFATVPFVLHESVMQCGTWVYGMTLVGAAIGSCSDA
jgi:hypothetical protein